MQKKKTAFLSVMKPMMLILATVAILTDCSRANKKTLVPTGATMQAIYAEAMKDDSLNSISNFIRLENETDFSAISRKVTKTAKNPVRVNNPDIALYVYAHPASTGSLGNETVIVPSYTTHFPLYTRVHYRLNR